MVAVRKGLAVNLAGLVALLATLRTTVGLSSLAGGVGLTCGVILTVAVVRGLVRSGADALGPADKVTLARATLGCGLAALVADSFVQRATVPLLVALAVIALTLDAVDGRIARRTRTSSVFGARFDGEADAFLILVLSVYVARTSGTWVLAIGAARYAFAVAGWAWPSLRAQLPPRYWRKVVTAVQGIALTFAAADVASQAAVDTALVMALALLIESFGRDVLWLWQQRFTPRADSSSPTRRVSLDRP